MLGRCFCRAVRYSVDPPIVSSAHCHCESCRRSNSTAFVTWATVVRSQLQIVSGNGDLARHESSLGAFRIFCGKCGSHLFMEYASEPEWAYFTVASLETSPRIPPKPCEGGQIDAFGPPTHGYGGIWYAFRISIRIIVDLDLSMMGYPTNPWD